MRWLLALVLLAGCVGGPLPDAVIVPRARSTRRQGPTLSYVPAWAGMWARIDGAALRASPNAAGYASLLGATSIHRQLLDRAGIDPIDDLDRALVIASHLRSSQLLLVGRHGLGAHAMQAIVERATPGAPWASLSGFPAATWPCTGVLDREIVLTSEREIVIAPEGQREHVIEVALDHLERGGPIDPAFEVSRPFGELVRVWATSGLPGVFGAEPISADLLIRDAGRDRTEVTLDLEFGDASAAHDARDDLARTIGAYAREPTLPGIARVLARTQLEVRDRHVIAFARLGDEELGSALTTAAVLAALTR